MRSADTSPDVYARQTAILRSMPLGARLEQSLRSSEELFRLAAVGIRMRHPEYDKEQVDWAFRRLRLGDTLFRRVWPGAPLLAP
jgi:hypothetical protein